MQFSDACFHSFNGWWHEALIKGWSPVAIGFWQMSFLLSSDAGYHLKSVTYIADHHSWVGGHSEGTCSRSGL